MMSETEKKVKPVAYLNKYPGLGDSDYLSFHDGFGGDWIVSPLYGQAEIDAARRQGFEEALAKAKAAMMTLLVSNESYVMHEFIYDGAIRKCMAAVAVLQPCGAE